MCAATMRRSGMEDVIDITDIAGLLADSSRSTMLQALMTSVLVRPVSLPAWRRSRPQPPVSTSAA